MIMDEATTIKFTDIDTGDEGWAVVHHNENSVVIGLSLKSDGDIQVVMKKEDARKLSEALKKAVA
jgi:hypothetical protein